MKAAPALVLLIGGKVGALLFAFLYRAKKLTKQHLTGFECKKHLQF